MNTEQIVNSHKSLPPSQLAVALVGGDPDQRSAVKDMLAQINEFQVEVTEVSIHHSWHAAGGHGASLFMAILDPSDRNKWRPLLRPVQPANGQATLVVALINDPTPDLIRTALRSGADDVIGLPPGREETLRCLLRASELQHRGEKVIEKSICSLISMTGGAGVSHLAMNIGFSVQRLLQKRTALIDLDLQAAALAVLLDVEPEHTIAELADPTSTVDSIRLESVLCRHESGLYLLAPPKRIEEAELVSAATVEATLKVMRDIFDIVLIDCGTYINEGSVVAWESSDHLIYVIEQSVTAIRSAQRFLKLYQRLGFNDNEPKLILNRYSKDQPITREQIEAALHLPIFATLPRDDRTFTEMQITGKDAWKISSASAVRSGFEGLAAKLFAGGESDFATGKQSLIGRLLHGRAR